jgi:hypothetical protein
LSVARLRVAVLGDIMLSVVMLQRFAEYHIQSVVMLSVGMLNVTMLGVIMLSVVLLTDFTLTVVLSQGVIMLSVTMLWCHYAKCQMVKWPYPECSSTWRNCAKCHNGKCNYAKGHIAA